MPTACAKVQYVTNQKLHEPIYYVSDPISFAKFANFCISQQYGRPNTVIHNQIEYTSKPIKNIK